MPTNIGAYDASNHVGAWKSGGGGGSSSTGGAETLTISDAYIHIYSEPIGWNESLNVSDAYIHIYSEPIDLAGNSLLIISDIYMKRVFL